ncbi:helix-turn-helix domain-containing protein [Brevundimonas sp.]|jgi:HTH-type transcriptional regulator/antitoxin HipB|uniref:helix-turn-helix domain-containing protein n=1 Tax=Brevundimonas sp. TaxID=1871086 RepID=UPI0037C02D6C
MIIRSARELGAAVKARRKALGEDQAALASRSVCRGSWISALENGKSTLELGLVLQTLRALDMPLSISPGQSSRTASSASRTDLNALIDAARRR